MRKRLWDVGIIVLLVLHAAWLILICGSWASIDKISLVRAQNWVSVGNLILFSLLILVKRKKIEKWYQSFLVKPILLLTLLGIEAMAFWGIYYPKLHVQEALLQTRVCLSAMGMLWILLLADIVTKRPLRKQESKQ